jgi:NAD+ diphosphatase
MTRQLISYTNGHLNRAGVWRKDPAWVADRLAQPDTLIIPVWRNRNLIRGLGNQASSPTAVTTTRSSATRIVEAASEMVFLGLDAKIPVFTADLSTIEKEQALDLVGSGEFVDLRRVGPLMEAREATLMAYARGMLHWHRHHRYCGHCGQPTESQQGGHMRLCTNPDCGQETFPRTDPAVIMLVEHTPSNGGPPQCLLGRHSAWPSGSYSTLAGFVEPVESLEEAVAREVFEEVGIRVAQVRYQASQPWPFPASLMLGFRAQAETTTLKIDPDELAEARWFTAEKIRSFGEWGDDSASLRLPRKDSIARFLVEDWLGGG